MNNLTIKIGRDGTLYDFSELFTKATFGGRKGAAPRTLEMQIADFESLARDKNKLCKRSAMLFVP